MKIQLLSPPRKVNFGKSDKKFQLIISILNSLISKNRLIGADSLLMLFGLFVFGLPMLCSAQNQSSEQMELDVTRKDIIIFNFKEKNLEKDLQILYQEHIILFRGDDYIAFHNQRTVDAPMRVIPYTFISNKDTMIIEFSGLKELNYYINNICFRKGKFSLSLFNNKLPFRALYDEVLKHKSLGRDLFNKEESTNILFKGAIARPEYKIKNLQLKDVQFIRIKPSDRYVDFGEVK